MTGGYFPKGTRPARRTVKLLPKTAAETFELHRFIGRHDDPVSCVWCALPMANRRHAQPLRGAAA